MQEWSLFTPLYGKNEKWALPIFVNFEKFPMLFCKFCAHFVILLAISEK